MLRVSVVASTLTICRFFLDTKIGHYRNGISRYMDPPPVISWFINPINWFVISTINHSFFATTSQLKAIFGAPSCISVFLQIFLGAISRSKENAPVDTTLTHIHRAGRRILRLESGWKICVGHFHCPFTPSLDIIGHILYLWTLIISYIWIETSGLCV